MPAREDLLHEGLTGSLDLFAPIPLSGEWKDPEYGWLPSLSQFLPENQWQWTTPWYKAAFWVA